jgi:hypothetical protein
MQRLIAFMTLCGLVLTGCAAPSQEIVEQRVDLAAHYAPTTLVEVLQAAPTHPYALLAEFDAQAPAGTTVAQLLARLQSRAAALGANALIVQDLSTREAATVQFNPSGGQMTQTGGQLLPHLRAQAIRYITAP